MQQLKPSGSASEARPSSSSKSPAEAPGQQQLPPRPWQQWHTSVWAVWDDPPSSVMGAACPCCLLADNVSRLDGRYGVPWCTGCAWALLFPLLSYALVGGNVRAQLREQLDLPGSTRTDYLLHIVLCWCAVCQEARELKYRSVLSAPPRPGAKLLEADTAAPQIQLMRAESRPRGALIKEWKRGAGAGAAGPAGSASSSRAASLSPPKQAAPMTAVPEAATEGAAAEAQEQQQSPAAPAAEAAMPSSESGIEEMLRAQSMRVEMAVQAAKRIEAQATQKELQLQQESAQRR